MKLNSPEMKKSLKADADAFNANTKKMNTFGKELDNATDKQKDALSGKIEKDRKITRVI